MSVKDMSRQDLINELVGQALYRIRDNMNYSDVEVMEDFLRRGFRGFEKMTADELKDEYRYWFNEEEV
jgi:hypothetical protein